MAWSGTRRATLPPNWHTIRQAILHRDPMCQLRYEGCDLVSVEVDHIGSDTDHRWVMLRGVCSPCHKRRTQQQARAGRGLPARRPAERHPGRR